jgi:DNA anti-recombination protein RmuC
MNSSEWIWRTGKAERERDALEERVKELVAESDRQTEEIASLTRILEGKR